MLGLMASGVKGVSDLGGIGFQKIVEVSGVVGSKL